MKLALWILPCCALALFLSNCSNDTTTPGGPTIVGPFDSQGNYREDWADNPSKWTKQKSGAPTQSKPGDYLPPVASANDQPPVNSVPLAPKSSKPAPVISKTEVTEKPVVVKSSSSPTPSSSSKPKATTKKPEPEREVAKSSSTKSTKSKPKTTVAKAKPKPKPKATRYTVKSGDTLSAIASRNGTSVSALRSANGISGSMIHPGQSLTIPKK